MLNLSKYSNEFKVVAPVINKRCVYNRKVYHVDVDDGWYECIIKDNIVLEISPSSYLLANFTADCGVYPGYYYKNGMFVFGNFDTARRYFSNRIFTQVCGAENIEPFTPIKVCAWYNEPLIFTDVDYSNNTFYSVISNVDDLKNISDVKGITPELRYMYNMHIIEMVAQEQLLKEAQKKVEEASFAKTLEGRLVQAFNISGATLQSFTQNKQRGSDTVNVIWSYEGSGYTFNSVLDSGTLQVIEAGYCLSGHDSEHTAISIVKLAQTYERSGDIYITRR